MAASPAYPVINGVTVPLPPPEGWVVDFENPEMHYVIETYVFSGIGIFISLFFLAQRLYTKIVLANGLQIDDAFLIVAFIISLAAQILIIWSFAIGGQGRHAWETPIDVYQKFRIVVFITAPLYTPCGSSAKLALLIFYLRLSPQRWFKRAVWATIAIIAIYSPIIFFSMLFVCRPFSKAYAVINPVEGGECLDLKALFIALAVVNVVTDVIMICLPIPMVLGLKMSRSRKVSVIFVFSIGSVTLITSIIRAAILPSYFTSLDQSWELPPASFWVAVEANLLVICGCMTTLRNFLKHMAPRLLCDYGYGSGSHTDQNAPRTKSYRSTPNQRSNYARFGSGRDADDLEFQTLSNNGAKNHNGEGSGGVMGIGTTIAGAGNNPTWEDRPRIEDDDSEKAIVQTKTVTIQYN